MQRRIRSALLLVGVVSVCLLGLVEAPVFAGLQGASGTLASCAGSGPGVLRDNADLIAVGTVEDVKVRSMSSTVRIGAEQVYKGATSGETIVVTTASGSQGGSSVDVQFEEGARYLLYLQEKGGEYTTDICSGTQPLEDSVPPELAASLVENATSGVSPALPETSGPAVLPLVALSGLAVLGAGRAFRRWVR